MTEEAVKLLMQVAGTEAVKDLQEQLDYTRANLKQLSAAYEAGDLSVKEFLKNGEALTRTEKELAGAIETVATIERRATEATEAEATAVRKATEAIEVMTRASHAAEAAARQAAAADQVETRALDELAMHVRATAAAVDSIGPAGIRAGTGAAGASRAVLEMSRGIEDFSTGGFLGVLNNIPGTFSAIGMAAGLSAPAIAGLTGGVSLLATGAYLLYTHWDKVQGLFGNGKTEAEAKAMEHLKEATEKTANEIERLHKLQGNDVDEAKKGVEQAIQDVGYQRALADVMPALQKNNESKGIRGISPAELKQQAEALLANATQGHRGALDLIQDMFGAGTGHDTEGFGKALGDPGGAIARRNAIKLAEMNKERSEQRKKEAARKAKEKEDEAERQRLEVLNLNAHDEAGKAAALAKSGVALAHQRSKDAALDARRAQEVHKFEQEKGEVAGAVQAHYGVDARTAAQAAERILIERNNRGLNLQEATLKVMEGASLEDQQRDKAGLKRDKAGLKEARDDNRQEGIAGAVQARYGVDNDTAAQAAAAIAQQQREGLTLHQATLQVMEGVSVQAQQMRAEQGKMRQQLHKITSDMRRGQMHRGNYNQEQ